MLSTSSLARSQLRQLNQLRPLMALPQMNFSSLSDKRKVPTRRGRYLDEFDEFPFQSLMRGLSPMLEEFGVDVDSKKTSFLPKVDFVENEKQIKIVADVPGIKPEDIKINLSDNVLSLSGERKVENVQKDEGDKITRMERSYGYFSRKFSVPDNIVVDGIRADFDNGVIEVTLPKDLSGKKEKTIDINISKKE